MLLGCLPIIKPNERPAISRTASKENKSGVYHDEEYVVGQTHCWRLKVGHTSVIHHSNMSGKLDQIGVNLGQSNLSLEVLYVLVQVPHVQETPSWGFVPSSSQGLLECYSALMYL